MTPVTQEHVLPQEPSLLLLPKIEDFFAFCRARDLSPRTVRGYRADLADLVSFFGPAPVALRSIGVQSAGSLSNCLHRG
jgi:hypothetical protein